MTIFSGKNRSPHLGPFPLEQLSTTDRQTIHSSGDSHNGPLSFRNSDNESSIVNTLAPFMLQLDRMRDGPIAAKKSPIPDDYQERATHIKSAAYFLNASMVGICNVPDSANLANPLMNPELPDTTSPGGHLPAAKYIDNVLDIIATQLEHASHADACFNSVKHQYGIVIVVEYPRDPDPKEAGGKWIAGAQAHRAALRSAEIAVVIAQYIRLLGYPACTHTATTTNLNNDTMVVAAGLGTQDSSDKADNPFLDKRYGVAVVSTDLDLAVDKQIEIQASKRARNFSWWLGLDGAQPGYSLPRYKNRAYHLGLYPMETLTRRETTTTIIESQNIPRVPKRHDMFTRAAAGELGDKSQKQMQSGRCVTKFPFANAMTPLMAATIPLQEGQTSSTRVADTEDPVTNSKAIKAALHYLGADIVGISDAPDYVWYSHQADGSPIVPYHKYAITALIDQSYDTLEGSSGDDWASAAQSMRAYMRANLVCSMVAAHIRSLGYSARSHGNPHQDVLHIPLIMLAGLGELSRIGELVLNPFIGPRIKTAIITTDMPLAIDKPIDFGLQDFCNKCNKCARECPASAIPFGDKIMFNGYEMWKPDVEKCARYRITNTAGAMCGRCMKVCPFNLEGVLAERPFHWAALNLPFTRRWLAKYDDKIGRGRINKTKKWWWDLDTDMNGVIVKAGKSSARELNFRPRTTGKQRLAAYPFAVAPAAVTKAPVKLDRKAGVEWYRNAKKPNSK